MKNLQLSILIIALIAITLTGCKKIEEIYSCDPVTNEWVKTNLAAIQKMDREALLQLEPEKQRPAFRAFTPEQRYNCLVDKLEQVKTLEWTEKEFAHICLLVETMKLEWFEETFRKNNADQIDNFLTQWVNDGISYFGWTKDELGRMVACLYDVEMEDDHVVLKVAPGGQSMRRDDPVTGGSGKPCTCSQTSDWCSWEETCKQDNCDQSNWGCGTILIWGCNGRCK